MTNIENLYDYVFFHNPYEGKWYAIERNSYLEFFNGSREKAKYIKSSSIKTLEEIITKENLNHLINE